MAELEDTYQCLLCGVSYPLLRSLGSHFQSLKHKSAVLSFETAKETGNMEEVLLKKGKDIERRIAVIDQVSYVIERVGAKEEGSPNRFVVVPELLLPYDQLSATAQANLKMKEFKKIKEQEESSQVKPLELSNTDVVGRQLPLPEKATLIKVVLIAYLDNGVQFNAVSVTPEAVLGKEGVEAAYKDHPVTIPDHDVKTTLFPWEIVKNQQHENAAPADRSAVSDAVSDAVYPPVPATDTAPPPPRREPVERAHRPPLLSRPSSMPPPFRPSSSSSMPPQARPSSMSPHSRPPSRPSAMPPQLKMSPPPFTPSTVLPPAAAIKKRTATNFLPSQPPILEYTQILQLVPLTCDDVIATPESARFSNSAADCAFQYFMWDETVDLITHAPTEETSFWCEVQLVLGPLSVACSATSRVAAIRTAQFILFRWLLVVTGLAPLEVKQIEIPQCQEHWVLLCRKMCETVKSGSFFSIAPPATALHLEGGPASESFYGEPIKTVPPLLAAPPSSSPTIQSTATSAPSLAAPPASSSGVQSNVSAPVEAVPAAPKPEPPFAKYASDHARFGDLSRPHQNILHWLPVDMKPVYSFTGIGPPHKQLWLCVLSVGVSTIGEGLDGKKKEAKRFASVAAIRTLNRRRLALGLEECKRVDSSVVMQADGIFRITRSNLLPGASPGGAGAEEMIEIDEETKGLIMRSWGH